MSEKLTVKVMTEIKSRKMIRDKVIINIDKRERREKNSKRDER